jgi:hypothetical protein
VPVRKTISDEMLLRYNGMLASVFELLADSRDQVAAVNGYIDALKDYWLAETDLQQSLGGRLPPLAMAQTPNVPLSAEAPATAEQPAPAPMQDSPLPAPATQPASPTNSEGK